MLKTKYADDIASILARYPSSKSAVLPLCYLAQDEYGYLRIEHIQEVADLIGMPYTDVYGVATFYSLLYEYPVGTWVLQVCDDNPCCFLGAEELVADLEQRLEVQAGEMSANRVWTLQRVKCIGACHRAPVLQANLEFVYDLTPDKVPGFVEGLARKAESGETLSISGRFAEH